MNQVIALLLQLLVQTLARFLIAFIRNLDKARMNDPSLFSIVADVVGGIGHDYPDMPNEQKRQMAFDAIKQWGSNLGRDLKDSLVNALIELAVQETKTEPTQ